MVNLNDKLKKIYNKYKTDENPPVPLEMIKEFLELDGVHLDE